MLYAAPHGVPHLALWDAGENLSAEVLVLGEDGRLKLQGRDGETVWDVRTRPGTWLEVRPSRLVLVDDAGVAWEAPGCMNTPPQPAFQRLPGALYAGDELASGEELGSRGGNHQLMVGPLGVVIKTNGREEASWSVRTEPPPTRLAMQGDGNLVAYEADGRAVWSTGTAGREGAWARLTDQGALLVEQAGGVLWSSLEVA